MKLAFRLILGCTVFVSYALYGADPYQEVLINQLISAQPGSVINIPAGNFEFDSQLSLSVNNVTIRGQGLHKTILNFKLQTVGAEGLLISSNGTTLADLTIRNTKGDGIKWNACNGVTVRGVRVDWTEGPITSHGSYGFYPVLSRNILIEASEVSGALDAGIYVGQSENAIVRNNIAVNNIAGIEIENTIHADVYGNYVSRNTAGILVFNNPGLSKEGAKTRVYNNTVVANNSKNEAPVGNAVSAAPGGTGLMIFANKKVEVFQNLFAHNDTSHIILVNYLVANRPPNDDKYDPFPKGIYIYNNTSIGGGTNPIGGSSPDVITVIEGIKRQFGVPFPSILFDGAMEDRGIRGPEDRICIQNNLNTDFLNVIEASRNLQSYDCALAKLSPVVLESAL